MKRDQAIGIIAARGGSKGLPGKNVIDLLGKPMIAWTIEAARASIKTGRVIVSTDCPEIAATCEKHGAEAPFLRPPELARDDSHASEVMTHALEWLKGHSELPDFAVLLQPTSPLRLPEDIDRTLELAETHGCAAVSVTTADPHPFLAHSLSEEGTLEPVFSPDQSRLRRQLMPPYYVLNGAVYAFPTRAFLSDPRFCPPEARAHIMPAERSLDVDSELDLKLVETILRARQDDA